MTDRTRVIWQHMKQRCNNPNSACAVNYLHRGIDYTPDWETYEGFLADMGEAPDGLTLERVDNSKGYELSDCVWATRKEQAHNRRSNKLTEEAVKEIRDLFSRGEATRSQLAKKYGVVHRTICQVINGERW